MAVFALYSFQIWQRSDLEVNDPDGGDKTFWR